MTTRRRTPSLIVLCGVLLGFCGVLLAATPAAAHATVVDSDPKADAILDSEPETVTVEFNEAVSVVAADTQVVAPDGTVVSDKASAKNTVVSYRLDDDLPEGTYLVSYRVTSADGHPVPGGFTFSVGKKTEAPAAGQAPESDPLVAALVMVNRYLGYLGLAGAAGATLLMMALPQLPQRRPRQALVIGLSTVAMTAVLGLYLQAAYTAGTALSDVTGPDVGAVLGSRFGGASMLRMLLVLLAIPLLRQALLQPSRAMRFGGAAGGLVLAATWPLAGHATTSAAPPLTMVTGTLHVAAAAVWVGGLAALLFFLFRSSRAAEAGTFLPIWSGWATWLVTVLAVAGVAQAMIYIGAFSALVSTGYGRLVIAKLVAFAALLGLAGLARRLVTRRAPRLVTRVRRLVTVELVLGLAVIAVSASLVQAVPAVTAAASQPVSLPRTESRVLEAEKFSLEFELEPAAVGTNTVHLYSFAPNGADEIEPRAWQARYGEKDGDLEPVAFDLEEVSANHRTGEVSLPRAGKWTFSFTIRTSKFDQETVDTVVSVN